MGLPGFLYGVVVDTEGVGIGGATIQSKVGSATFNATTVGCGAYMTPLPSGTYTISCIKQEFVTQGYEGVIIPALGEQVQNFIMSK